jgi:hypothetical protein
MNEWISATQSSVKQANGAYVTTRSVIMSDGVPVRAQSHVSKKSTETTNIYRSSTTGGRGQIINQSLGLPAVVQNKTCVVHP